MESNKNHLNLILLCLSLLICFKGQSQKEANKTRIYKAWVKLKDGTKQKGFLYAVDDDTINIISSISNLKSEEGIINIRAKDIDRIFIRRKGKVLKSSLIGFLGTALVFEIALSLSDPGSEDSYIPNEATAISMGILFGGPIGALVGSGRKKFEINGDETVFKLNQEELINYAFLNQKN